MRSIGLIACLGAVALVLLGWPAEAALRLPRIFTNDMVLQQDLPIAVWGWAGAGEAVTVCHLPQSVLLADDASYERGVAYFAIGGCQETALQR
jgi:sialate O-acetylesterase